MATMIARGHLLTVLIATAAAHHHNELVSQRLTFASAFTFTTSPPSRWRNDNILPFSTSKGSRYVSRPGAQVLVSDFKHHRTPMSSGPNHNAVVVAAASPQSQHEETIKDKLAPSTKSHSSQQTIYLHAWVIVMTAFIVVNAKFEPFPEFLLHSLTRPQWSLVHAVCSMLFSGTIVFSALMEYSVIASKKASSMKFWFLSIPRRLDARIVLPALTGAIVSGVGQASIEYGGLVTSPKHVLEAFHLLLAFGLWWGLTDVTSQRWAEEVVLEMDHDCGDDGDDESAGEIPMVMKMRAVSNIVSCLLVVGMYALMVLKPGLGN